MKAELDAYNAEKQRMKAVVVSDNDIIHVMQRWWSQINHQEIYSLSSGRFAARLNVQWTLGGQSRARSRWRHIFRFQSPVFCCYIGLPAREENCHTRESRAIAESRRRASKKF